MSDRRPAAILLAIAALGLVALPPTLARLRDARRDRADTVALSTMAVGRPQPLLVEGVAFVGARGAAAAALRGAIRDIGARGDVLVERNEPLLSPTPDLVARHAIVSGSPRAILRFVETIESRAPVVRLSRYRLATNASGASLRLEADVVMAVATP